MKIILAIENLIDGNNLPKVNQNSFITDALNIAFAIMGAVAVFIIVLAGARYVFARDNPESVSKARSTIAYTAIGLVFIALAAAIVNLVIGKLGK